MFKKCKKCQIEKEIQKFERCKNIKDGFRNVCKQCSYERRKQLKRNKELGIIEPHIIITVKRCRDCRIEKPIECFNRNKSSKDKYNYFCRDCSKIRKKIYIEKNKESVLEEKRKYWEKNKNRLNLERREKRPQNLKTINEVSKRYYCNNIDKIRISYKKYYWDNVELLKEKSKRYYSKNRERLKQKNKEYRVSEAGKLSKKKSYARIKKDPIKLFRFRISSAIKKSLKKRMINKENKSSFGDILSYSPLDLIRNLESQFKDGMTWDNYGAGMEKWSIDHKIPDSWFDYSSIEDEGFKQSWSLENLWPMWNTENYSKKNRYCGSKYSNN